MKEEYKVLMAIWILYGVFLAVRGINDLILLFLVTAFVIVFTLEIRENGIGPKEKET